ncbi:ABC transporter ATP-binding protein [Fonticula alba]|uniref:ABC transporter ATP-binding protein n=1 Tax=Fonticula alba TaxID=691883 RepID=A0A058ZGM4_FONAL|nr:ABC transporter ATP-binding protein [Fonticula alba]KCV73083.1 ABC transporter ATP-binding protein [Fonticula alba]|eukprot:XP_009492784.1 ABC transporter ATP-binding protein [Fonticula alba]
MTSSESPLMVSPGSPAGTPKLSRPDQLRSDPSLSDIPPTAGGSPLLDPPPAGETRRGSLDQRRGSLDIRRGSPDVRRSSLAAAGGLPGSAQDIRRSSLADVHRPSLAEVHRPSATDTTASGHSLGGHPSSPRPAVTSIDEITAELEVVSLGGGPGDGGPAPGEAVVDADADDDPAGMVAHITYDTQRNTTADCYDGETPREDTIIHLNNVHKTYLMGVEGVPALRGVSLSIRRGEWVVIYGTSGGGKTTMLNLIGTIDKPTKGELWIGGRLINPKTPDSVLADIRLGTLGFVFQTFNLLSSMTARENVELPMILKGDLSTSEIRARAVASLERMNLHHRMDHMPNMLSGGEQQRVAIARAIANRPSVLLLDEPTGDLDTVNTKSVVRLLRQLNELDGMTLVMVTHDVYLKNFATRVVWMRDGKVAQTEVVSAQTRARAFRGLDEQDLAFTQLLAGGTPVGGPASTTASTAPGSPRSHPPAAVMVSSPLSGSTASVALSPGAGSPSSSSSSSSGSMSNSTGAVPTKSWSRTVIRSDSDYEALKYGFQAVE